MGILIHPSKKSYTEDCGWEGCQGEIVSWGLLLNISILILLSEEPISLDGGSGEDSDWPLFLWGHLGGLQVRFETDM